MKKIDTSEIQDFEKQHIHKLRQYTPECMVLLKRPHALMTSYNLVNGEHTCNRKDLVTEVLRNEWHYEGIVMTDWSVTSGINAQKANYPAASAAGCIKAGNDLIMPGSAADKKDILDALHNENHSYSLNKTDLQACVKRVLAMISKLTEQSREV
jgi:beta-glucosidase